MRKLRHKLFYGGVGVSSALTGYAGLTHCGGGACGSCFGCGGLGVGVLVMILFNKIRTNSTEQEKAVTRRRIGAMRAKRMLFIFLVMCLGVGSETAFAQTATLDSDEVYAESSGGGSDDGSSRFDVEGAEGLSSVIIPEVVVTASRKESLVQNVPASVTVIDAEDLRMSPLSTVDDVLRSVAGVDVWGNNQGSLGQRAVTVRGVGGGSDQERTLILVNGIPVNDTWSGQVSWSQIPKEDVERIEVVRGPSSSLYGGSAMGGVVNLILRTPAEKPVEVAGKGSYGELNTWSVYANVSGRTNNGKFGYYVSGKKMASDGYIAEIKGGGKFETETEFDTENVMGQLFWYIDDSSSLTLSGTYYREERERGYPYSRLDPSQIFKGNLTYRRTSPQGVNWFAPLYGHDEEQTHETDTWTHTGLDRVQKYEKPFYGAVAQPSIYLADWNTLTLGTEFKYSEATHNAVYEVIPPFRPYQRENETGGKQHYLGVYFEDEMLFFDGRLVVIPGARYDWWKSFDGSYTDTHPPTGVEPETNYDDKDWHSFNPKLGVVYHLSPNTSFRGSVGRGYRAPSPVELYATMSYGTSVIMANPDLDPESIISYEIGVTQKFGNHLDARLTLYQSTVDDLIDTKLVEVIQNPPRPPTNIREKENIGEVRAQGVELELFYLITSQWYGFLNYTYNDSEITEDESDPAIVGNTLSYSPPNKFNIGLTYDNPRFFTGSIQGRFSDKSYSGNENTEAQKLDSYWTFDLRLQRELGRHITLGFDIENIFDEKYDIPAYTPYKSVGRLWAVSLAMVF